MEKRDPRRQQESGEYLKTHAATGDGGSIEPSPAPGPRAGLRRRDSEIRADLDARLAGADEFDPNEVDLLVKDGVVLMLGHVPDQVTKTRLEELAVGVPGVRELHDQLRVLGTTASSTSDGLRTDAPRADSREKSR